MYDYRKYAADAEVAKKARYDRLIALRDRAEMHTPDARLTKDEALDLTVAILRGEFEINVEHDLIPTLLRARHGGK